MSTITGLEKLPALVPDNSPRRFLTPWRCRILLAFLLLFGFFSHLHYLRDNCPLDLSGDEAQYWDWSRHLDWNYYSKGPVVAFLIRASCGIFGDVMWAVRLPALVLAMGTGLVTYLLTLELFKSERIALGAVAMNGTVPMFVAGSLLMTIDPPFFFCWALATYLAAVAIFRKVNWPWPLVGVAVGIGFLSKYAMFLWLPTMLLTLWIDPVSRPLLRRAGPWVAVLVALLFSIPVLVWNQRHGWVSVKHVATQTGSDRVFRFAPGNLFELVFGQVAVLGGVAIMMGGGVIYALLTQSDMARGAGRRVLSWERLPSREKFGKSMRRRWEGFREEPRGREMSYLLWIGLPFLLLTLFTALRTKVQMNWPAPAYFSLMILGTYFLATRLRDRKSWKRWRGWLYGAIVFALLFMPLVHNTEIIYPAIRTTHHNLGNFARKYIEPRAPRTYAFLQKRLGFEKRLEGRRFDFSVRLKGWSEMARRLDPEFAALGEGAMVLCDDYQRTAEMSFYLKGQPRASYAGSYFTGRRQKRHAQYDLWPDRSLDPAVRPDVLGRNALYVGWLNDDVRAAFNRVEGPFEQDIVRKGIVVATFRYARCYGFKGMTRPAAGESY